MNRLTNFVQSNPLMTATLGGPLGAGLTQMVETVKEETKREVAQETDKERFTATGGGNDLMAYIQLIMCLVAVALFVKCNDNAISILIQSCIMCCCPLCFVVYQLMFNSEKCFKK